MPSSYTLNQDFFKSWSSAMAYVLGYFAADGSMLINKRGSCFIEFTSTDRVLLERVQKATGSNHRISKRPIRHEKWKQSYRLQVGSKEWFGDLTALNFTQSKSHTLVFPAVPENYFGDFIRGYFDGDGCVYFNRVTFTKEKRVRWILMTLFTSGSKDFLDSLLRHLRIYGVRGGSLRKKERGYDLRFSHKDSLALYKLMYHTGLTTGLWLPRKQLLFEKALKTLYGNTFLE